MAEQQPAAAEKWTAKRHFWCDGDRDVCYHTIYAGSTPIAQTSQDGTYTSDIDNQRNARRIVASVNLLAPLTVEAIESLTPADILAALEHKVAGDRVERLEGLLRQAQPEIYLASHGNKELVAEIEAALSPAPAPSEEEQR